MPGIANEGPATCDEGLGMDNERPGTDDEDPCTTGVLVDVPMEFPSSFEILWIKLWTMRVPLYVRVALKTLLLLKNDIGYDIWWIHQLTACISLTIF